MNKLNKVLLIALSVSATSTALRAMNLTMQKTAAELAKFSFLQRNLEYAIREDDTARIKEALAAGADINKPYSSQPSSPEHLVTIFDQLEPHRTGNAQSWRRLLAMFPHTNINKSEDVRMIQRLVVEATGFGNTQSDNGSIENLDALKLLLQHGLNVNAPDTVYIPGNTLLHAALEGGVELGLRYSDKINPYTEEVVKLLLQYGVDPKIKNSEGKLAIDYVPAKYKAHYNAIIGSGHAAYLVKQAETKHRLLQESKAAAEGAGEHGLPGGVAGIIAQYAVGPEEITAVMHAQCAREAAAQAQEEKKAQGKIKTDQGS